MNTLITHVPAADVTDEFKTLAKTWPLWESKTHPQKPPKSGKFHFDYNGDYDTERVLITKGSATLTPDDGSEEVKIGAGDSVYFHKGFACMWHVTTPMAKHYAYCGEDGEELKDEEAGEGEGISCDACGVDCFAESYLCAEEDICPECYGKAEASYPATAEHQREGTTVLARVGESIRAKRVAEAGGEEYLMRWKKCTWEEDSWEPSASVLDEALITDFEAREERREALLAKSAKGKTQKAAKRKGSSFLRF